MLTGKCTIKSSRHKFKYKYSYTSVQQYTQIKKKIFMQVHCNTIHKSNTHMQVYDNTKHKCMFTCKCAIILNTKTNTHMQVFKERREGVKSNRKAR